MTNLDTTGRRRKPLPDHGTYSRASGSPSSGVPRCPCPPCRRTEYLYDRRRRHLAATGRALTVPPAAAAEHLRQLRAGGVSIATLMSASGLSRATLTQLIQGRPSPIHRSTANAVLAIPASRIAATLVPAIGSTRRVRALIAIGHSKVDIQRATGLTHTTLWQVTAGTRDVILPTTAEAIATAYRTLASVPGTSERARKRAADAGWCGPAGWGDEIDEAQAAPESRRGAARRKRGEAKAERNEQIRRARVLHGQGFECEEIGPLVGVSGRTVFRWKKAGWPVRS